MSSRDTIATAVHGESGRAARTIDTSAVDEELSTRRLNIMRVGYAFMGVGLVIVKWPILLQGAAPSLPVFEGVVACLLTAMSLLAFLGLRYPTRDAHHRRSRGIAAISDFGHAWTWVAFTSCLLALAGSYVTAGRCCAVSRERWDGRAGAVTVE